MALFLLLATGSSTEVEEDDTVLLQGRDIEADVEADEESDESEWFNVKNLGKYPHMPVAPMPGKGKERWLRQRTDDYKTGMQENIKAAQGKRKYNHDMIKGNVHNFNVEINNAVQYHTARHGAYVRKNDFFEATGRSPAAMMSAKIKAGEEDRKKWNVLRKNLDMGVEPAKVEEKEPEAQEGWMQEEEVKEPQEEEPEEKEAEKPVLRSDDDAGTFKADADGMYTIEDESEGDEEAMIEEEQGGSYDVQEPKKREVIDGAGDEEEEVDDELSPEDVD